ncbi:hypothetical protein GCM10017667_69280 [Streptomyces filamentosus]|uniref:Uncharacterized protein n=1 Tax=Streptomyces filamentosus TaxID=67294 RepID=A0A919ESY1_STRFL|nr:hypothetical protein GCM10017667_69280 [Streptomyces filamentosus]
MDREDIDAVKGQRKVRGSPEAALAGGERLYGQRMDGFDLVIVDVTHGTAGDLGRPWRRSTTTSGSPPTSGSA